jgi:NAD(P)-dependent dehydrogenase (short-subunit alcohol dehydrogenase family)
MAVPALAYSAVANVASRLLKLEPKQIPPTTSSTTETRRRVALVTGSNTGVGYQTAKTLAQDHGFEVIIACRSSEKGIQACSEINTASNQHPPRMVGGKAVFVQPLDLADLESVRAFCQTVNEQYDTIDVLVNNAGRNSAGATPDAGSPDLIFQTNFMGHFLLTNLLVDKCRRIVNLASVMHHFPKYSKWDDDDINSIEFWRKNAVEPTAADAGVVRKTYAASKLAALLFSLELNRRYGKSKGIRSIAVNPGSV